jgi:hypothetical protein
VDIISVSPIPRLGSLSGLGRRERKSTPARTVFDDFAGQYLDIDQESGEKLTASADLQSTTPEPDQRLDSQCPKDMYERDQKDPTIY